MEERSSPRLLGELDDVWAAPPSNFEGYRELKAAKFG